MRLTTWFKLRVLTLGFLLGFSNFGEVAHAFDELGESLAHRFGVRLTLVSYDLATARAMWRTRTVAAERSVKEAELLVGTPLEELLSVGQ